MAGLLLAGFVFAQDRGPAGSTQESDQILTLVGFTFAAVDACKQSHPTLAPQVDQAFGQWRTRNKKYVELALRDQRFEALKKDLLASRPPKPLAESQCRDTIRSLGVSAESDIDALRSRNQSAGGSGNSQDSIGYPSVQAALDALRHNPSAKFKQEAGWTIVTDGNVFWSFTPQTHPAHPAAVKRTVFEKDGAIYIQMSALCQSDKAPCDKLIEDFKVLNGKVQAELQRRAGQSAPSVPRFDGVRK